MKPKKTPKIEKTPKIPGKKQKIIAKTTKTHFRNSQTEGNPTFEEDKTRHADFRQDPDGQDHHPRG
jgi:hypothetical protein